MSNYRGSIPFGLLVLLAAISLFAVPMPAQAEGNLGSIAWYCDNLGNPVWGDGTGPSQHFWEPMHETPSFGSVSICDLDPVNPFYACSPAYDRVFYGTHFWAEIWLGNNYRPIVPRQVDAELYTGSWGQPGIKVASATVMVTDSMPGAKYVFDFGVQDVYLTTYQLILKIIYYGPLGDTHIYWDNESYPTAVHAEGFVSVESATWGRIKALYR